MARFDGTSGNDVLTGTIDDDELFGYGGQDTLDGGAGDDYLNPGDSDSWDQILGSSGNDTIVFTDNAIGNQWLDYSESDFQAGIEATIDGETNTATVDKSAAGTDTIVDIVNPLESYGGFSLYGTGFDDVYNLTLQSGQWMEVLGGAGDDIFNIAGSGAVRLDYRYVDNAINVDLSEGKAYNDGFGDVDTINGVIWEVRGTDYSDVIVGSDNHESFIGRLGDDTIDGGGGWDRLRFDRGGVGDVQVDLEAGTATGTWDDASFSYTIANIERVLGGAGNDEIRGSAGSERLEGGGGDDTLIGGAGNDTLVGQADNDTLYGDEGDDDIYGGAGSDHLQGGDGDDTFWGGEGADVLVGGSGEDGLSYYYSSTGVRVDLVTGAASGGDAEGDIFSGIENLYGSAHADHLVGDGGNNKFFGNDGDDTLIGGAGNDSLIGGAGGRFPHGRYR